MAAVAFHWLYFNTREREDKAEKKENKVDHAIVIIFQFLGHLTSPGPSGWIVIL